MSPPHRPPGLSAEEAARRLAAHGPNASTDRERHGLLVTLRSVATEPMFLLLLGAAAVYLVLGDLGEGLLLSFFALVTVGLVIFQERRSEHALDALRSLAAPQVRVWRDGREQRIPARDLVPGDLFLLAEGERVAADGVVREAVGLAVDESLLTGESVPVRKQPADGAATGADEADRVSASTLVVAGHALVEATATGNDTRVGHIGASLAGIETAPTPLQFHLRRLVQIFGAAALVASGAVVLWYGLSRGEWLQGVLSAIALGMAMLPEEFPMALAVFLSLGAWRLARIQVLARRPAVIEALGSATVLCVDKTGTLTENRMQVRRLVTAEADVTVAPGEAVDGRVLPLLTTAMRASRRGGIDPMDRALVEQADAALAGTPHPELHLELQPEQHPEPHPHRHPDWQLVQEYPLTPDLLAMTLVWADAQGQRHRAAKGAPEAVFDLCHLSPQEAAGWMARVQALAGQGLRVLAVARGRGAGPAGTHAATATPHTAGHQDRQHDHDYDFLGLVAFEDPLRPSVPGAVAQARAAGIAVAMITGDHAATALAIAGQAGIDVGPGALTGAQIAALDDAALDAAVRRVRVYARVQPEQKLRLVQALRRNGETVAMTGDGVNDAPALKAAHIGIAMGVRGTDVAREAAGLVLLDEDFGRIVGGVRMGRRIFDNLRKVMVYITAIHIPIVGLALLPLLFGLPPLMLPAHVVLTEMVIDPVCSLAFEGAPEDPRLMSRPPRRRDDGIVGWPMLRQGLWQGGSLLAATLTIYLVALDAGRDTDIARTLAVLGLTAGNLLLVAVNTTAGLGWRALGAPGARAFWWVAALATAALAVAVAVPGARALLHFGVPAWSDLGLSLALVAAAVLLGGAISLRQTSRRACNTRST